MGTCEIRKKKGQKEDGQEKIIVCKVDKYINEQLHGFVWDIETLSASSKRDQRKMLLLKLNKQMMKSLFY